MKGKKTKHIEVGTVMYGLSKKLLKEKAISNIRIVPARIISYQTIDSKIYPVFKRVGANQELCPTLYEFYKNIDDAIGKLEEIIAVGNKD